MDNSIKEVDMDGPDQLDHFHMSQKYVKIPLTLHYKLPSFRKVFQHALGRSFKSVVCFDGYKDISADNCFLFHTQSSKKLKTCVSVLVA